MPDIFLSYSRDDLSTARRFAEAFEREGFSVWWDQTLRAGEVYDRVTEKALQEAKAVVVLWSNKSVESHWVRSEATQAQSNGTLVPVMIEACKRPIMFELMHTAELAHWKGDVSDPVWRAFLGDVRQFAKKEGAGTLPAAASAVPRKRRFGMGALVGIVAAVLLMAGLGLWAVEHRSDDHPKEVTLAVLPFANLSSDPEQEYFSDGLTEEILDQLAQIKDLVLIGRTSSFSFKGKNEDLRVIAGKLGVANLLEGSIRRNGNQLRITAQLINGSAGTNLWSRTYERELKDAFVVQEEIAKDVAQALSIKLDVGDMPRSQGGTTNLEAYDKYLRAHTLLRHFGNETIESAQLFREATALDPTFWRAWYGLQNVLSAIRGTNPERAEAAFRELRQVRIRLLTSAPESFSKQVMLAHHFFEERRWAESEAAIQAALVAMPASEIDGRLSIGLVRMFEGHPTESLPYFEYATRADPLTIGPSALLETALLLADRSAEAQAEHARGRELSGDHVNAQQIERIRLMVQPGTGPEIVEKYVQAIPGFRPSSAMHRVLANLRDKATARAALNDALKDPDTHDPASLFAALRIADYLGDKDLALGALELYRTSAPYMPPFALWQPYLTRLRSDPRFKDIVRGSGLIDLWRSTGDWGDFCKSVGKDDFECH